MMMPPRLQEVGDLERADHFHLPRDARCYFWGEYTPYEHTQGKRWNFSPTNQLIANLKKRSDRASRAELGYKNAAIQQVAEQFARSWKWQLLHAQHRVAVIPIPPSKARTDPAFDGRMLEVLMSIARTVSLPLDIRDCLSFSGVRAASHEAQARPTPDELYTELRFDPAAGRTHQQPGVIFLFDDMLTTGAHYVAATRRLVEAFPDVPIIGNFVARRILPNPFEDFEAL